MHRVTEIRSWPARQSGCDSGTNLAKDWTATFTSCLTEKCPKNRSLAKLLDLFENWQNACPMILVVLQNNAKASNLFQSPQVASRYSCCTNWAPSAHVRFCRKHVLHINHIGLTHGDGFKWWNRQSSSMSRSSVLFWLLAILLSIKFCFQYSNWFCCTWSYFSGNFAWDRDLTTDPMIIMSCDHVLMNRSYPSWSKITSYSIGTYEGSWIDNNW